MNHPDEIAVLQAEGSERETVDITSPDRNAAHIPVPSACSPSTNADFRSWVRVLIADANIHRMHARFANMTNCLTVANAMMRYLELERDE